MENDDFGCSSWLLILFLVGSFVYGYVHNTSLDKQWQEKQDFQVELLENKVKDARLRHKRQSEQLDSIKKKLGPLESEIYDKQTKYIKHIFDYYENRGIIVDTKTGKKYSISDFLEEYWSDY